MPHGVSVDLVYPDETTAARGDRSLKIRLVSSLHTSSNALPDYILRTPSLHENYMVIDDFETDPDATEWYNGSTLYDWCFAKIYDTAQDFSSYSAMSIYTKCQTDASLYVAFQDTNAMRSPWSKISNPKRQWGRCDASISWGNCDNTDVQYVLFHEDSNGGYMWIDELMFYEASESNRLNTWINLMAYDSKAEENGNLGITDICGGYGGIIHNSTPSAERGTVRYKTNFVDMDEDIRWLDMRRRRQTPLFLRMGEYALRVIITAVDESPEEGMRGIRNDCSFQYIEA